jgi:hypothetical protein
MIRILGGFAVFVIGLSLMIAASTMAWDVFINGKLYYCTDGGALDFLAVGDWVHHPESVAHIVPRSMSEPDEIKQGWSMAGLKFLWGSFVVVSVLVSAMLASRLWFTTKTQARKEIRQVT